MPRPRKRQAKTKSKRQARKEDTEEEESSGCDTNRFDDQRFGESEDDDNWGIWPNPYAEPAAQPSTTPSRVSVASRPMSRARTWRGGWPESAKGSLLKS